MQEIAILFSSIAGACTVAAIKKFPKNKAKLVSLGANSQIKSQINSLRIEKEVLTKTITRLYQNDAGLGMIKRDRMLSRYQHQLGVVLTKIEKLEAISKHPDLGPVGEGLSFLMSFLILSFCFCSSISVAWELNIVIFDDNSYNLLSSWDNF